MLFVKIRLQIYSIRDIIFFQTQPARKSALVAQRIELFRPKEEMGVQFPPGAHVGMPHGGVAERLKATVLKTVIRETVS